jgi:hypothetical protein
VLRLHDLPPCYVISDSSCETWSPAEEDRGPLDRWILKYWPEGCDFTYEQLFQVPSLSPSPPVAVTQVTNTPSEPSAEIGFGLILRELTDEADPEVDDGGTISIGPAGPVAHIVRVRFRSNFGTAIFWRQGRLIAGVASHGMKPAENDQAALHLAQIQQGRIEAPSPYTEAERDDTEVELDNPSLEVPVYWLGREFSGGGPGAELETARVTEGRALPGAKIELRYDTFNLETWTRQGWKRFQSSFFRKINHPRCTRTVAFEWGQGHAVISAGYRRRTFEKGCPDFPPTRYWAAAHIGGVVVGVNQTTCRCLSPGSGFYSESLSGIKTLLRSLTLRPKPVYAAAP